VRFGIPTPLPITRSDANGNRLHSDLRNLSGDLRFLIGNGNRPDTRDFSGEAGSRSYPD